MVPGSRRLPSPCARPLPSPGPRHYSHLQTRQGPGCSAQEETGQAYKKHLNCRPTVFQVTLPPSTFQPSEWPSSWCWPLLCQDLAPDPHPLWHGMLAKVFLSLLPWLPLSIILPHTCNPGTYCTKGSWKPADLRRGTHCHSFLLLFKKAKDPVGTEWANCEGEMGAGCM